MATMPATHVQPAAAQRCNAEQAVGVASSAVSSGSFAKFERPRKNRLAGLRAVSSLVSAADGRCVSVPAELSTLSSIVGELGPRVGWQLDHSYII